MAFCRTVTALGVRRSSIVHRPEPFEAPALLRCPGNARPRDAHPRFRRGAFSLSSSLVERAEETPSGRLRSHPLPRLFHLHRVRNQLLQDAWLSAKTGAISDTIQITRHYAWKWIPSSLLSSWRYRPLDKDQLRETNPLLFILQGFCSVPLVGPSSCPLEYLDLTMKMQRERYVGNGPYCDRIGTDDSV